MTDLNTALLELADTEGVPEASTLDDFIKRFPQFAREITEFAIELATDPMRWGAAPELQKADSRAGLAVSHFFNRMHALESAKVTPPVSRDPLVLRNVGTQLGVNAGFLSRVWSRAIEPDTIPPPFTSRLSKALHVPEAAVCAYLAEAMTVPKEVRHKAEGKPTVVRRQSFDEAAVSSGLTPEQIAALKKPL